MTRPLFSLSYGTFGGILMVLYSLFLIQLGGILLAKEKKRKKTFQKASAYSGRFFGFFPAPPRFGFFMDPMGVENSIGRLWRAEAPMILRNV